MVNLRGTVTMARRLRSHLSYANVMATVAVFIAIGTGGAYAVDKLGKDSVGSKQIKAKAVKTKELADNAVTTPKVKDGSLLKGDFAANQLPPGPDTPQQIVDKLRQAAEPWHEVGPGSNTENFCSSFSNTGVFCSEGPTVLGGFLRWENFRGGYATAAFYKDQLGIVHLRGLVIGPVKRTFDPTIRPIFRLPEGYRPESRRLFTTNGRDGASGQEVAAGRIDVDVDGLVHIVRDCGGTVAAPACSADGQFVSLDGINFRPDE
jgi:hypothetical protein